MCHSPCNKMFWQQETVELFFFLQETFEMNKENVIFGVVIMSIVALPALLNPSQVVALCSNSSAENPAPSCGSTSKCEDLSLGVCPTVASCDGPTGRYAEKVAQECEGNEGKHCHNAEDDTLCYTIKACRTSFLIRCVPSVTCETNYVTPKMTADCPYTPPSK